MSGVDRTATVMRGVEATLAYEEWHEAGKGDGHHQRRFGGETCEDILNEYVEAVRDGERDDVLWAELANEVSAIVRDLKAEERNGREA